MKKNSKNLKIKTEEKSKFILSFGILTIIAVSGFFLINYNQKQKKSHKALNQDQSIPVKLQAAPKQKQTIQTREFFDQRLFNMAKNHPKEKIKVLKNFHSVVVPHHLLASRLIGKAFGNAAKEEIKTVIIAGPNHFEKGEDLVYSTRAGWQTPFGYIEPDLEIIKELKKQKFIELNKEILEKEHAIAGLAPYIKYYFPKAKIVPLVLSSGMKLKDTRKLAQELAQKTDKDTLLIGSIDFSHYLDQKQAMINDQITIKAIKEFDYKTISGFNNDFVDSPASLNLILITSKINQKSDIFFFENTNSTLLLNDPTADCTSYITFGMY